MGVGEAVICVWQKGGICRGRQFPPWRRLSMQTQHGPVIHSLSNISEYIAMMCQALYQAQEIQRC